MELNDALFSVFEEKVIDEDEDEVIISKKRRYEECENKSENSELVAGNSKELSTVDDNLLKDNETISTKKIKLDVTRLFYLFQV